MPRNNSYLTFAKLKRLEVMPVHLEMRTCHELKDSNRLHGNDRNRKIGDTSVRTAKSGRLQLEITEISPPDHILSHRHEDVCHRQNPAV
jgi:hypothetical protein